MPRALLVDNKIFAAFFKPLFDALNRAVHTRQCNELPDQHWLELGVTRILMESPSGRGFLQQYGPHFQSDVSVGLYFESLKSNRRLLLADELNDSICAKAAKELNDPLQDFEELKKYDIYAADGHWHGASAHEVRKNEKKWAPGYFYALNLRSHAIKLLDTADEVHRKHEHDMRALKRMGIETLRQGAKTGRKVLYVYDSASIDFDEWDWWKSRGGIYFVSRMKDGTAYECLDELEVDHENGINHGITSDEKIIVNNQRILRRIVCVDPQTGKEHVLITNQLTISPGLLAQLYRMRWDIEKVFDEFKNTLQEKKAWAGSVRAKKIQANFLCLAHNLCLLMEHDLEKDYGVSNEAEIRRRQIRFEAMKNAAKEAGRKWSTVYECVQRYSKRSVKFIRCLRSFFFLEKPLIDMAAHLIRLYAKL